MERFNRMAFLSMAALAVLGFGPPSERPDGGPETLIEVPVQQAFIPRSGFDDNDNVQIVLHGQLPSPCYSLADARVEKVGGQFVAHQMAWQRHDGACGTGDMIDLPVPFTNAVSLGRVAAADYQVKYATEDHLIGVRPFNVAHAVSNGVDNFPYAAVTGVDVTDEIEQGKDVIVEIHGVLTSTCAELRRPIGVQKLDDVLIVMPIQLVRWAPGCRIAQIPFTENVNLGPLPAGAYLAHVRSMNGSAVYQAFDVYKN